MPRDSYMPSAQADQIVWSQRFATVVCQNAPDYGVPAALATGFIAINTALIAAWAAASEPTSRTKVTVDRKDNCLRDMKAAARSIVSIVQGMPSVTSDMLLAAGLTVRKTTPSKKPVPTVAPYLEVVGNVGRTVTVELRSSKTKRGKPANVQQATVFTHVGPDAPTAQAQWIFTMNTTQTTVQVPFSPSATGDTVYLTAFWSNAKGEAGPSATPVSVNLPAGGVMPSSAATARPSMKLRAAA